MTPTRTHASGAWRDRIAPRALLVFLAVATVSLAISHVLMVSQTRAMAGHSRAVIQAAQELISIARDAESNQRGYLASGDHGFIDDYHRSRGRIPAAEQALSQLVADDPPQRTRAAAIRGLVERRLDLIDRRVQLSQQGRRDQSQWLQTGEGRRTMDQLRGAIADLIAAEESGLEVRSRQMDQVDLAVFMVGVSISALAIIGLAVMMANLQHANRRLQHEIGARETAQAARLEAAALHQALFDTTGDRLYVIDVAPDGRFILAEVNPAYEAAVGASKAELRGMDVADLASPAQREAVIRHLRAVTLAEGSVFRRDHVDLPGGERIWESVLTPVRNAQGVVERIVGSSRDVTEREQAQDQLRRVQRMEVVGHLTGGIAHDFNNLLQVIRGNLELLSAQVGEGPGAARVRNALHASERAAQLTRQLLAFARRQPLEPKVVNLGRLVSDMTELLRRTLGEQVAVETLVADGLWNSLADPAQIESSILNLALNARDAMPNGGRLKIELGNAVLGEADARRYTDIEPGQYVQIAVSDTGHGMDRETLRRVFEPFFTTKAEEKGTGLGLSMVYGFVKQSNGHVLIFSEIGVGTTVKIFLPRARLDVAEDAPPPEAARDGDSRVILVVEDDDLVRASVVGMLRDLGYICIHASDGAAALEMLKGGARVDLLFTDVIMPGPVKCRELARQAQALRPGLPVLYTSGYSEDVIVHEGRLDDGIQLLSKPYARETLAAKVQSLLQAARPVVLVVEDDHLVRMATVDMVEAAGYAAVQAADAKAALAVLNTDQPIDLLFTDVGLPGMRGTELAVMARQVRPTLKVVFASGYGDLEDGELVPGADTLRKPYEQDQLAETLARMLLRSPPPIPRVQTSTAVGSNS